MCRVGEQEWSALILRLMQRHRVWRMLLLWFTLYCYTTSEERSGMPAHAHFSSHEPYRLEYLYATGPTTLTPWKMRARPAENTSTHVAGREVKQAGAISLSHHRYPLAVSLWCPLWHSSYRISARGRLHPELPDTRLSRRQAAPSAASCLRVSEQPRPPSTRALCGKMRMRNKCFAGGGPYTVSFETNFHWFFSHALPYQSSKKLPLYLLNTFYSTQLWISCIEWTVHASKEEHSTKDKKKEGKKVQM